MTPTVKIVTGIASVGVVGSGVGYAISTQFATENIIKRLTNEGYQILNKDDSEWAAILTSYEATVKKDDKLKFKDFAGASNEVEKLKQECKKALESHSTDNDNYAKAKHWCTVPRTLAHLLDKEGYRALNTSNDDNNEDKDKWDKKLDAHAKDDSQFKGKKFDGDPNIKATGNTATKEKANRDAIKGKCKGLENKKHYEVDFETNLAKSKLWCAIEKSADS